MATSPLRKLLEREAGEEEFRYVIPHPFLPPRYQEASRSRNMLLLFDRDMTLHVRWEGARLHEHSPLTPRAAIRLLREVARNMTKYRRELHVFSRFIDEIGEAPFEDPRYELPAGNALLSPAKRGENVIEASIEAEAPISITQPQQIHLELGGESAVCGGLSDEQ